MKFPRGPAAVTGDENPIMPLGFTGEGGVSRMIRKPEDLPDPAYRSFPRRKEVGTVKVAEAPETFTALPALKDRPPRLANL